GRAGGGRPARDHHGARAVRQGEGGPRPGQGAGRLGRGHHAAAVDGRHLRQASRADGAVAGSARGPRRRAERVVEHGHRGGGAGAAVGVTPRRGAGGGAGVRVLGIDPGGRLAGWGVVEARGGDFRHLASGTIVLAPAGDLGARLARLHAECLRLIAAWEPAAVVLERAFVARNVQSAFRLGEARGAVLAAAGAAGAVVAGYAPARVKLAT